MTYWQIVVNFLTLTCYFTCNTNEIRTSYYGFIIFVIQIYIQVLLKMRESEIERDKEREIKRERKGERGGRDTTFCSTTENKKSSF